MANIILCCVMLVVGLVLGVGGTFWWLCCSGDPWF